MASETIRLFERLEKVRGENALTEALAACLRVSQEFQKLFLRRVGADDRILKIETQSRDAKSKKIPDMRGGPACLDRMFQFLSGASRCSAYAAVRRAGRLSKYTPSGVCPSSARCGLVWL